MEIEKLRYLLKHYISGYEVLFCIKKQDKEGKECFTEFDLNGVMIEEHSKKIYFNIKDADNGTNKG